MYKIFIGKVLDYQASGESILLIFSKSNQAQVHPGNWVALIKIYFLLLSFFQDSSIVIIQRSISRIASISPSQWAPRRPPVSVRLASLLLTSHRSLTRDTNVCWWKYILFPLTWPTFKVQLEMYDVRWFYFFTRKYLFESQRIGFLGWHQGQPQPIPDPAGAWSSRSRSLVTNGNSQSQNISLPWLSWGDFNRFQEKLF